ncbi:MAG: glycosyltransferase family 4 protein [Nitrospira sp.]
MSQVETSASRDGSAVLQHEAIKVIVFSHNLDYEGASISLKELVVELFCRRVINPEIVTFADGPLRSEYVSQGISVQVVPGMGYKASSLNRLSIEIDRLVLLMRGVELVLANTLLSFIAVLAAERANVPSVWIIRESESWDQYFRFLPDPVAQRAIAAIGLPRKVVFAAHATRAVWDCFDTHHSFNVIHNGIDLDRFPLRTDAAERRRCRGELGVHPDSIVILSVGTLCDRKNQIDLVDAFVMLPQAIVNRVQILLVGDDRGGYANALKKRCHSLSTNAKERIRIVPATESVATYYAAADLFILSSKVESFPRVVLEAMAFGLPIITTPVFGVLEQVVEGENALFYPPGDSRLLAEQIKYVVRDEACRLRMAESSRQRISQMTTFDEMIAAYASISREAVS